MDELFDKIIAEVRELATKYPDAVYESGVAPEFPGSGDVQRCFYDKGVCKNGPESEGCIFGQVLRKINDERFNTSLKENPSASILGLITCVFGYEGRCIKANWMKKVQVVQDKMLPWAKAVEEADKAYPLK